MRVDFLVGGHKMDALSVMAHRSEADGISPEVAAAVDRKLFIPPFPADAHTSESLNVAVATAICCSEFRRREFL